MAATGSRAQGREDVNRPGIARPREPLSSRNRPSKEDLDRWETDPTTFLTPLLRDTLNEERVAMLHAFFRHFGPAWVNGVTADCLNVLSARAYRRRHTDELHVIVTSNTLISSILLCRVSSNASSTGYALPGSGGRHGSFQLDWRQAEKEGRLRCS